MFTPFQGNEWYDKDSRVGNIWSPQEDIMLCQELAENIPYLDIAIIHHRTITGIKARVITKIIYPEIKKGEYDIQFLSNKYKIDIWMINKYIN